MSWTMEVTTTQKARKEYDCQACDWLNQSNLSVYDLSDEELAVIDKAKTEGGKILKGSLYTKTSGKWEGEFDVFRARLDIHDICLNHEIYPEY